MRSSEKFILSISTLDGSHKLTLTKRIAFTPQEQILLKYMLFKERNDCLGIQLYESLYQEKLKMISSLAG